MDSEPQLENNTEICSYHDLEDDPPSLYPSFISLFESLLNDFPEISSREAKPSNQDYFTKKIELKFLEKMDSKLPNPMNSMTSSSKRENKKSEFRSIENSEIQRQKLKNQWQTHEFKNLVFGPITSQEVFFNHLLRTYKGLLCSQRLIHTKEFNLSEIKEGEKYVKLVSDERKEKTLLFDLDNTLIATTDDESKADMNFHCFSEKGDFYKVLFNVRPFAKEALSILTRYYELYIFTSAKKEYANRVIDLLDPDKSIFNGILHRKHCLNSNNGFYIKDLGIIVNKEMKDMLIVDDLSYSFAFQIDNGIPILPWFGDRKDCELKYLAKYLINIVNEDDLRKVNRKRFKLREMVNTKMDDILKFKQKI